MPVVAVAPEMEPLRTLIETGVGRISEGTLLQAAVTTAPRPLHLTSAQAMALSRALGDVYEKIAADPCFAGVPSALSEAVSRNPARPGHYFLYQPVQVTEQTPVIVFLHGFGGNFQFYGWLLKSAFPDHAIVCPSYGIAWSTEGKVFLDEVLVDVARRLGVGKRRPWLMGISAGGPASFGIYNAAPEQFAGLICLATCPEPAQVAAAKRELKLLMLNGVKDDRYPIEYVRRTLMPLVPRLADLEVKELANADHFFMLTMANETFGAVKAYMGRHP
jgi:pimeloyl-ACP methyl ester carboxylesterase